MNRSAAGWDDDGRGGRAGKRASGRSPNGSGGTRRPVSQRRYLVRRFVVLASFGLLVYGGIRVAGTLSGGEAAGNGPDVTVNPATTTAVPVGSADATAAAPTTTVAPTAPDEPVGTPTPDDPARILVVGDSDAGTFGPYLQRILHADDELGDLVEVSLEFKAATGLARPDHYDWVAHLGDALAETNPDIVIASWGGNDGQGLSRRCDSGREGCSIDWVVGDPVNNTEEWTEEYSQRVHEVLDMMQEGGRPVIWVGIPNSSNPQQTAAMRVQDQAVRGVIDERDGVVFVDTWDMFAGANGNWAEYVPDPRDGKAKDIRAADGFHLNETGAEILALAIFDEVEVALRELGAQV